MKAIGIHIGTTIISGVVIDGITGEVYESRKRFHDTFMTSAYANKGLQDPEQIFFKVESIIQEFLTEFSQIESIGVTGQTQGIMYVDRQGKAVTPLYQWKKVCSNQTKQRQIGMNTLKFCTIADYIVMQLTHRLSPILSPSIADGLGIYMLLEQCFDMEVLLKAGINVGTMPEISNDIKPAGYAYGIPVSIAYGDYQADIIGSIRDIKDTILVKVGTGSRISVAADAFCANSKVPLKAFRCNEYIFTGASTYSTDSQILLEHLSWEQGTSSYITTPDEDRDIGHDISEYFMLGFFSGIVQELCDIYSQIKACRKEKPNFFVGSGVAIRNNPSLKKLFEDYFQMKMHIPLCTEEAAFGAALISLTASGTYTSLQEAQQIIRYIE